jgi:hypothetical protein
VIPSDIEQIVEEVVRRLKAAMATASLRDVAAESNAPKQPTLSLAAMGGTSGRALMPVKISSSPRTTDVLVTHDRLLTLSTLDGKLDGLRRLVAPSKAIVTPSLLEELSRRGIELDRGGNGLPRAEARVSAIRFDAEQMPKLSGLGLAEEIAVSSAAELVERVTAQLKHGQRRVLVITPRTEVALCVLNRSQAIRAALASNVDSVRSATKAIAANVIVVQPAHLGRTQFAAIVRAIENEATNDVPKEISDL